MNLFNQTFTLGQIADATGIPVQTIKTWVHKKLILSLPTGGEGPGVKRQYSFFGAMEIAIAGALLGAGVRDNDVAFNAATSFSHTGDGPLPSTPARIPGCPYGEGLTFIAVGNGKYTEICYRPGKDQLVNVQHDLGGAEVMILVEITPIFKRVVAGLGYDPVEAMQMARSDIERMAKEA